ncbi:MAG: hypothetical protein J5548_14295 [Prevotella sp.]|nr:hypothetical protein [Prevotella sp.]
MSYVFRFHKGSETIEGWQETGQIGTKDVEAIEDPNGAKASLPITSIPTPFAGFELAKTAFAYCAEAGVKGSSIYHKLAANALDVLEIFFGFRTKYARLFQIVVWDKANDLQRLAADGVPEHAAMAATLQLFLSQDGKSFNFSRMQFIYMLNYIGEGAQGQINIVGGTSPTSVCMASANDLSYVSDVYLSNYHLAFHPDEDGTYRSLVGRDREFREFVYLLAKQPEFNALYNEFHAYVDACFRADNDTEFKNRLNAMQPGMYASLYQPLLAGSSQMMLPGDIPLMCLGGDRIETDSDFRILSERNDGRLPLVLPAEPYFEPEMRYTTSLWNAHLMAPLTDKRPLEERTLPFDSTQYPYLTTDDVFEPYLIKTVFPINEAAFFTNLFRGNNKTADECQYLLPLKPEVMKYLSVKTLTGYAGNTSKPVFQLNEMPDGRIQAVINIPVQKGRFVTLHREYTAAQVDPDPDRLIWPIMECRFDLFLFPSYHVDDPTLEKPQRIYLVDEDTAGYKKEQFQYSVSAYKNNDAEPLRHTLVDRADKRRQFLTSKYFCLNEEFDYIVVSNTIASGILVPLYKNVRQGGKVFDFAIDFGTTNTHVEYKTDTDPEPQPLTITPDEVQVLSLNSTSQKAVEMIDQEGLESFFGGPAQSFMQEFVPVTVGQGEIARFPMRTNLCYRAGHSVEGREIFPLADYNIGFHYEKEDTYDYNETRPDLKWDSTRGNNLLVEAYFEEILMLIRNKVLLSGGFLNRTSITWFYPVCMQPYQIANLENSWNKLCQKLIAPQGYRLQKVAESLAPYYYYTKKEDVDAESRPVVSMDIGGGTTDFVVYHTGNTAALISSVRFAGNNIYGDFLGRGTEYNGFVKAFAPDFDMKLRDISGVSDVYAKSKRNSAEFISFLYSLDSNPRMEGRGVSFSEELRARQDLRVVLLLFYAAEVYYAAKLLEMRHLKTPAYITVSGTASKVLGLIGSIDALQTLATHIFNDVLGDDGKVELKLVDNPKEITCKGGLNMKPRYVVDDVEEITKFRTGSKTLDQLVVPRYKDVTAQVRTEVLDSYTKFVDYFFSLNKKYSFAKYLGVSNEREFTKFRTVLTEKAEQDFNKAIEARNDSMTEEENPELKDSLFFIPLTGGLCRLALYIAENPA